MPYKKGEGRTVLAFFVEGLDVKYAHLSAKGKRIILHDVNSIRLVKRLEERTADTNVATDQGGDVGFSDIDALGGVQEEFAAAAGAETNGTVLVNLLSQYPNRQYEIIYSISEPTIYYHLFENSFGLEGQKLKKKLIEELSVIHSKTSAEDEVAHIEAADGQLLSITRESGLAFIELLESVKDFLGKRIPKIAAIETSDIALMNMFRANYEVGEEETSVIVYLGAESSRLIFMKGNKFFHFAPVISEGKISPNIENTLYSRILLEQDSAGIARIDRIFLAGEAKNIELKTFLAPQFSEVPIEYLYSSTLDVREFSENAETIVSEYAIPIASAMRVLDAKNPSYHYIDFLPNSFKEGQKIFKLAWHGYLLMALLFVGTLIFTNRYTAQNEQVRKAQNELQKKQEQLAENQRLQKMIDSLTAENSRYTNALVVYDSTVPNYNRWSKAFYHLTTSVEDVNSLWIKQLTSNADGTMDMDGFTTSRQRIPRIANMFEKATLQSVMSDSLRGQDIYQFKFKVEKIDSEKK